MTDKPKAVSVNAFGERLRVWIDPDGLGVHITILWKKPPTLRRMAAGMYAAQSYLDWLVMQEGEKPQDFRVQPTSFRHTNDDRNDLTFHVRLNGEKVTP